MVFRKKKKKKGKKKPSPRTPYKEETKKEE